LQETQDQSATILEFENGNGWLTLRENILVEAFVADGTGYVDLLSKEKILLPYADVILASVVKTCEDCYALSFYPRQEQQRKVHLMSKDIWTFTYKNSRQRRQTMRRINNEFFKKDCISIYFNK